MRGFWLFEDDKDELIMFFFLLFIVVLLDIFVCYLKVIKICVKDDMVSNIFDSVKVKSNICKF